jgi:hypothetical protein
MDVHALATRVEALLPPECVNRIRMFGGITFMFNGNMLCCASARGLMVRVGAAAQASALESPHAKPCFGAGRSMRGFVLVGPQGLKKDADVAGWVSMARVFVDTLPIK